MSSNSKIPGFYTLDEAAQYIGVSRSQVSRYISDRHLKAISLGKQKLLEQSQVHKFRRNPVGNPTFRQRKTD